MNIIFCFAPKQATPFARNKAKTLCSLDDRASKEGLKRGIKTNARDQRLTRMFDIYYHQRKYKSRFQIFSEITAFAKLLHVEFISCVCGIQQFYAHTCTRCGPIFSFRSWFLLGGIKFASFLR